MADESMLSLFDTDAGFLDELTGGGDSGIGGAGTGMEGSLLGPNTGLGGMQGDSLMNSLTQPTQSTGIQGGFGSSHSQQMSSISGNQYSGLSYQSSNAAPSQFSAGGFGSQYNSQKLHHLNTANQMVAIGAGGQSQQGMMISQNQQQLSQPQFGSPPAGGAMIGQPQQQGARYQSFGVGNQTGVVGPRLPNPHQQIGMPTQNNMWSNSQTSPNQTSTNFIHQQHALGQIQRQPGPQQTQMPLLQQQVGAGSQQQMSTQYLTHHDYALNKSSSSMPTVSRYNQDINPNQANAFMQRMTSPPAATNRLSNVPMTASNAMNSFGQMQQQPFQQPHLGTQQARMPGFSANTNMPGMSQPQQQQYSGSYVHQRPQANSAGVSSGNFTNFPFQQQTSQIPVSQGMGDGTSRLSHYQNTSPNHSSQFLAGFPTLPQQRATTPSPRPTPPLKPTPPPSHTPDLPTQHTSPTSQGTVRQSTLQQQMELMSPPPGNSSTSSSPYHCSDASNSSLSQTPVKSSSFPTPVVSQLPASNNMVSVGGGVNTMNVSTTLPNFVNTSLPSVNTSLPNFVNTSLPNRTNIGIGPISPNVNNISIGQGIVNPQSISMEIQRLQQQLQQVHSLPQTNQTQQNMLDLQERIRTLRAKQELHLQRQKQLQQQSTGLQQNVQQNLQPQQQQQKQVVFQIPGMQQQQQNVQTIGNVQANMTGGQNVHQPIQIGQLQPTQQMQQQTQPQTVLIVTSNDGNKLQQQTVQMVPQGMQQVASKPQQFQQILQTSQQPQFNQGVGGVASQNLQVVIQSQQQQQQSLQLTQTPQAPSQLLSPHQVPTSTSNVPQQSQMTGNQATSSLTAPNLHLQTNNTPTQNQVLPVSSSTNIGNMPVIQLQLGTNSHGGTVQMMPKSEEQNEMIDSMNIEGEGGGEVTKLKKAQQQQEKANRIVAEAVARAAAAGNKSLPPLITSSSAGNGIPSTVCDVQTPEILTEDGSTKKKKKKRERKPKEPKEPKTPKTPKVKKAKVEKLNTSSEIDVIGTSSEEKVEKTPAEKKEKKPKAEKPKSSIKKKKKPPATFLKKKKKRGGSSDGSDVEIKITPPPSPTEDDGIQKRRSARNTKRKKYLDDVDLNLSDDDHHHNVDVEGTDGAVLRPVDVLTVDNPIEEDAVVVEKILGMRMRTSDKDVDIENDDDTPEEEVEEFFVKYKNYSYLHCEWKTAAELERDKRIQSKIKRYKMKKLQTNNYFAELDDEELFNADYVEVDRVLEVSITTDPVTEEDVTHFLVKWRALTYEESTWELQQDVDPEKVKMFYRFKDPPNEEERQHKPKPKSDEWEKREQTREYKGGNTLREYQLEGVNWLQFSWYNGQNCILADEMGLGKTIQSITFLYEILVYGIRGPFLVVVPLSTLGNWQREFETWTDMNAIVYHGSSISRNMLQQYEMFYRDENGKKIPDLYKFNALITTYEIIISDCEILSDIDWRCLIIDEAHRLKNKNCRLMEGLRLFDCEHRVLLTGTPLQNNVEELFSLLNFLEPERFNNSQSFMTDFGDLKTDSQVEKLKTLLKPMMLRRLKEDVEKNLAAKEETIVEVELTNIQKKYYRAILERNFSFLSKGTGSSTNVPNLLNTMMELRKCCNHPYLIKGAEDKIVSEVREKQDSHPETIFVTMVQSSGKLVLMDKLLPKLKQNGHKVLIFSQMIRVLDILEDYLIHKKHLYERLDGRIRGNLRQEAIDRFSKPDSDRFVFLLCTRAGGLGINLTAADTVIIYDSDWNPQNDLQAQARCHRIGQQKAVKVYRLVTRNSYEREMFDRASMKLGLDKAVLQSMGGEKAVNPQAQMSKKEIEELLRKGAYGALMEDDSAGDKFCEEDIDQILQRRTQVIQIESEGKGSTFAKASFSMSDNRDDIDINDPNFWQKWAKKADIDMDELKNKNELIIQEPRQRKQTARYGNDEAVMDISDLESSSDSGEDEESGGISGHPGKGKKGKRGRRRNKDSDNDYEGDELNGEGYNRSECFKVEKNLLVYGWGRWIDIISHGRFKRRLEEKDVEMISRALLIYSLQHYKGDEKIKDFIWDLVSPSNDGSLKNHSGLSAPVPRGRKGKNKKKEPVRDPALEMERSKIDLDPEVVLRDGGYRRHLHRHANKVLLRVRLLYYIKQEIIGDEAQKVFQGYPSIEIDIPPPCADGEPPTPWWDEDADRSLLVGVFKHGYEKFNAMRSDPQLVFLARCGPPDSAALAAEQNEDNDDMDDTQGNLSMAKILDVDEEASVSSASEAVEGQKSTPVSVDGDSDKGIWPTPSDLNTRLRRIITGYQRNHKRQQIKNAQRARKLERTHKLEAAIKERESQRRQYQQCRWSRREEADFYRVISSYGIEFDLHTGRYKWDRFRILARLEKKYDETLAEYFQAFYHMCMRVCKKFKNDDDALPPNNIYVEPITEERASRCLARIDLLNKIRTEILHHPKFEERVKLCQSSYDLPRWWMCGKHDKDLVLGAARHGVVRTDYNILYDPALSFKEIVKNKFLQVSSPYHSSSPSNLNPDTPLKEKDEETEESKDGEPTIKKEMKEEKTVKEEDKDIKEEDTEVKEEVESAEVKKENGNKHELEEDDENDDENMDIQETQSIKEEVKKEENEEESKIKTEHSAEHSTKADLEVKEELKSEVKEELMDTEPSSEIKEEVKENGHLEEEEMKPLELVKKEKESMRKEEKYEERKTEKCDKKEEKCDIKKMEKSDRDTVNDEVIDMVKRIKEKEELLLMERRFSREDEELQRFMPDDADFDGASGEQNAISAAIQWPKDRVIFHRLEHICYCVEHGEWPFPKRMSYIPSNYDSRSGTPMGSSTPKDDADQSQSDAGDSIYDGVKVMNRNTLSDKDFEVEMTEGDGLKMTFHRRADKIGQKKFDMEGELGSRVQQILNQSKGSAASSDNESPSDLGSGVTPRSQVLRPPSPRHSPHHYYYVPQTPAEMLPNGTPGHPELDPVLLNRSLMEHALMFPERRRRGRKRKAEKMAEIAMAEALARRQQARALATLEPDSHVPVINLEDGSRISGDEAPTKKDLDRWLDEHPGYMVDRPPDEEEEFIEEPQERRRGRRPRVDPALLDPSRLTGDENVSVVNRLTGKKITGAKAPPLKYLGEWLEQNPFFDVDPKWADLVKSNAKLPKSLLSRVVSTERRGRGRPRENILSQSVLAGENPFTSMAGLTGLPGSPLTAFHKLPLGMPFGAFPPLGMANPMLGLGFMPGLGSPLSKVSESDSKKDKSPNKKDTGSKVDSKSSSSATTTPHPSFPLMYNPLMFNPILAAQGLGFSLPSSLPTSFASLAHVNGQGDSDLEEGEIKRFSHSSERKRDHDRDQDMAQDLSMKRESSHHPHKRRREDKHGHHVKSSSSSSVSSKSLQQDEPTDLSMKSSSSSSSKTLTSPSNPSSKSSPVALTSKPQDLTKTKTKIQSSHKLSKIVDSLKSKVNKMEDKTKDKKSKLDNILRKLSKDSDSGEPSPTKSTSSMVSPNSSFIEEPKENVQKMLNMSESKSEDEKVTDDDVGVPLDDSLADDDEEKVMSDS